MSTELHGETVAGPSLEELLSIGWASPRRIRDFARGRACAHRAIQALGIPYTPLLRGASGFPSWPSGTTGSLTHIEQYCAAIVCHSSSFTSIGIDAESLDRPIETAWDLMFAPEELALLAAKDRLVRSAAATSLFVAKEAFQKSQYVITGEAIPLRKIVLTPKKNRFTVSLKTGAKNISNIPEGVWLRRRRVIVAIHAFRREQNLTSPLLLTDS